jgi:hypothetical protein
MVQATVLTVFHKNQQYCGKAKRHGVYICLMGTGINSVNPVKTEFILNNYIKIQSVLHRKHITDATFILLQELIAAS